MPVEQTQRSLPMYSAGTTTQRNHTAKQSPDHSSVRLYCTAVLTLVSVMPGDIPRPATIPQHLCHFSWLPSRTKVKDTLYVNVGMSWLQQQSQIKAVSSKVCSINHSTLSAYR